LIISSYLFAVGGFYGKKDSITLKRKHDMLVEEGVIFEPGICGVDFFKTVRVSEESFYSVKVDLS
jgi:hypothetical protein